MSRPANLLMRAAPATLALVACAILPRYMLENPEMAAMVGEGEAGPTLWPSLMLWLVGICAVLWLARIIWTGLRAPQVLASDDTGRRGRYNWRLAWLGIGMVLVYGFAIQYLGFAFATLLFLLAWFVLGGVRRPATLLPVAVLGTMAMLYVFVALAQMPLDRGRGVFTAATVGLYEALGIY